MNYSCFFGNLNFDLPEFRAVMLSLYAITAVPAIILNFLVLYCIWKTPFLHKPSYVLIASLALSDLLNASFGQYAMVLTNLAALNGWSTELFCYLWIGGRAMSYWMTSVSLYTLAIISIDRLLAIKKKTRYRSIVTMKRIIIIVVEFWVKSFILIIAFLFNLDMEKNLFLYLSIIGTAIFLMLSTITISYSLAYYYLKKATRSVSPNGSTLATNTDINVAKYRKSLTTMILVFLVLILFYLPYVASAVTTAFYLILERDSLDINMIYLFYQILAACELVAFLNSNANPLMYLWRMRDIRQTLFAVVRKSFRRQMSEDREQKSN